MHTDCDNLGREQCCLGVNHSATAQSTKPGVVTVVRVHGEARYSPGGNEWHPLVAGKVLDAGAVIQSAANSTVDLVLSGNPFRYPKPPGLPMQLGPQLIPMFAVGFLPLHGRTKYSPHAGRYRSGH